MCGSSQGRGWKRRAAIMRSVIFLNIFSIYLFPSYTLTYTYLYSRTPKSPRAGGWVGGQARYVWLDVHAPHTLTPSGGE